MLIYAGIDEAGYGPMLGPLCVGLTVIGLAPPGGPFSSADDSAGQTPGQAPDVWSMLAPVVVRSGRDAQRAGGIAVDDSKRLKLANSVKTRHPLVHLERGVLCAARGLWGEHEALPADCDDLARRLGSTGEQPGAAVALPIGSEQDVLRLTGVRVADAMERAGVRLLDLSCRRVAPGPFNEQLARTGSKAAVSWGVVRELIARVWKSHAVREATASGDEPARLVIDRQGGRTSYRAALASCFEEGVVVETVGEGVHRSVYEVAGDGRRMRVIVQREAETEHFPVALASMTAKLVRELAMERFNRAWRERLPEIKPTAGYVTDARRWLDDARRMGIEQRELEPLIRRA